MMQDDQNQPMGDDMPKEGEACNGEKKEGSDCNGEKKEGSDCGGEKEDAA